ncbi:MAG: PilZ domain-containing protein [Alphaproteobacteria bacterium]|nr:PilZ domain-containing protein [Alphaproteobacteria bacterium]
MERHGGLFSGHLKDISATGVLAVADECKADPPETVMVWLSDNTFVNDRVVWPRANEVGLAFRLDEHTAAPA